MAAFNAADIRERIVEAATEEAESPLQVASDVAFHLTDWLGDLEALVGFCSNPGAYKPAQINELLLDFLIHAPNHVAAATTLYAKSPVSDTFGVGPSSRRPLQALTPSVEPTPSAGLSPPTSANSRRTFGHAGHLPIRS